MEAYYQKEIQVYKDEIESLKHHLKTTDDKNGALVKKVQDLNDLVEKARVANQDLQIGFSYMREENLKLKNNQTVSEETPAIENEEQAPYLQLAVESVSWLSHRDKLQQKISYLERECQRYNRDNLTLGKQVRHLLRTLEEERGLILTKHSTNNPISNVTDVIDSHLVTFESIEQLQKQNQKLLSLVKELSKREEERETEVENEDIRQLNSDLSNLKSQLDSVKNDREVILDRLNTIIRERDLLKILMCKTRQAEHISPDVFQRMVSIACASRPAILDNHETTDQDNRISDLKAMIVKLEGELANQFDKAQIKFQEEIKLKTQLLEQAHLKIASETQQNSFLNERVETLEKNIQTMMQQLDETRTNTQRLKFELEQNIKEKEKLELDLKEEKTSKQTELAVSMQDLKNNFLQREKLQSDLLNLEKELDSSKSCIASFNSKVEELEKSVVELQRLRNIERAEKLKYARKLLKMKKRSTFTVTTPHKKIAQPKEVKVVKIEDQTISSNPVESIVEEPMNASDVIEPTQQAPTELMELTPVPNKIVLKRRNLN